MASFKSKLLDQVEFYSEKYELYEDSENPILDPIYNLAESLDSRSTHNRLYKKVADFIKEKLNDFGINMDNYLVHFRLDQIAEKDDDV